jgi:hypothetical protein
MEKKSPSERWAFLRETLEEAKKILSLTPTHTHTYISNLYANLILRIQVRQQNKYRHFTQGNKKAPVKEPTLFHFFRQSDDIIFE